MLPKPFSKQANRLKFHYPKYTIITPGWFAVEEWWKLDPRKRRCTVQERESALLHSLAVVPLQIPEEHHVFEAQPNIVSN